MKKSQTIMYLVLGLILCPFLWKATAIILGQYMATDLLYFIGGFGLCVAIMIVSVEMK